MTAPDLLAELAELRRRVETPESRENIRLRRNRFHDSRPVRRDIGYAVPVAAGWAGADRNRL